MEIKEQQIDSRNNTSYRQSCWKRRTLLEKCLVALLAFFVFIALLLIILLATWPHVQPSRQAGSTSALTSPEGLCLDDHCIRTAARILEAMDPSVEPCDDFFEYACGTWNRVNVIPDDKSNYNTFRKLGDELQMSLKVLMEESVSTDDPTAVKKVKYLYQSCLNTSLIESREHEPLITLINQLGGWPVLDAGWDPRSFDLETSLARQRLYGSRALLSVGVGADDRNSNVYIILFDQAILGLPSRDYYLKGRHDLILDIYEQFAVDVATTLGASRDRAIQQLAEMIDFEIKLANITIPEENRRDAEAMYVKLTIGGMKTNLTSAFDWLKFLQTGFSAVNVSINATEEVVVYASDYFIELGKLLRTTPKRTVANYVMWHTVMKGVNNLPQNFIDLRRKYNKAVHGVQQEQARWRTCVNYINEHLGMAVGRMFVQKHFDDEAKANALEMIENIRLAFTELLDEVTWMDQETRVVAKEKADAIQEKIGYPDYIMNDTALNKDYEGISIDPYKYFENVLSCTRFVTTTSMKYLRKPVDKDRWSATPAVVNAFYSATKNQIMFPAGILQPPFYHGKYPKYLQFSGIAIAVAHEITHGFDDEGRQYDKDGNLKQWWSNIVIEKFKEKAQCIIDQYSNYTVAEAGGINLNGRQTQGENIADNGGLKQAFRAYKRWVERTNQVEYLLPGIHLTHDQLFYLNFAQIWCGTARPESYVHSTRAGRHSPGRFRVIGSVSNSEDFARAFNCAPGSKMNPVNKCSVW